MFEPHFLILLEVQHRIKKTTRTQILALLSVVVPYVVLMSCAWLPAISHLRIDHILVRMPMHSLSRKGLGSARVNTTRLAQIFLPLALTVTTRDAEDRPRRA